MSRSRRKTPVIGFTTARSEQPDKREASRRLRRSHRALLAAGDEDPLKIDRRATGDPWTMAKDGKQRFDPRLLPCEMRK